jgi:hypothetical protein
MLQSPIQTAKRGQVQFENTGINRRIFEKAGTSAGVPTF